MKFKKALDLMKEGHKVKLPSWSGYWCWDSEECTIKMHCRPQDSQSEESILDIRDTVRVEYTLENILSNEWIIADETNTPVLNGVSTFSFSEALKYLKRGYTKLTRKGWNGSDQWVCLIPHGNNMCKGFPMQDCFGLKTVNEEMQPGWIPSIRDMLAEDWMFVQ